MLRWKEANNFSKSSTQWLVSFSHTNGSRYSFESLISDVKSTIVDSPYEGVDTNLFFSLPTTYQGMA